MKIRITKYVNATKTFPLKFDSSKYYGEDTVYLEEAYFYDSEEEALNDLEFDEPDTRQVLPVKITYEL